MFLMAPKDVEREVLRLHQFRKLHYEAAGSLGPAVPSLRIGPRLRQGNHGMSVLDLMVPRIRNDLEPILAAPDPRPQISAYHDMPYAIFHYDPAEEFKLRSEVRMLQTRLEMKGKRVTTISLAECLDTAMRATRPPLDEWFQAERDMGTDAVVETVHAVLSEYHPLVALVAERMPAEPDPLHDIVFIVRTGALFPATGPSPCWSS